ncbi:LysR family transcriptional regulator [Pelagibius sp.]|uniref:LysR family transcriptional regulator n=1 Tax=Pelagibius sp. TaxID=1931238 RepID=UPI003BB03F0E
MRLRDFEIIWAVARSRSMREAGACLGVSQPAVSRALRYAEERLGFELFRREKGRLVATPELQALMPDVERLFGSLHGIRNRARDMRDSGTGNLTIAAIPTLASRRLSETIASFRRTHPRVAIGLAVLPTPLVLERVQRGEADIGLVHGPLTESNLDKAPIGANRIVAIVPGGHPLAQMRTVAPRDLRNYSLIAVSRATMPGALIASAFARSNIPFATAIEVTTSASTVSLVQAGAGIGLVDAHALENVVLDGVDLISFMPEMRITIEAVSMPGPRTNANISLFLQLLRQRFAEGPAIPIEAGKTG